MSNVSDTMEALSTPAAPTDTGSALKPGEVALLDPDGQPMAFPAHLGPTLLQQGFTPDTPENRATSALRGKYGDSPILAAGAGALRGASLGMSDQLLTKSGMVNPATLDALQKYNPISSNAGDVAGTVGSMLIGDEVAPVSLAARAGTRAAEALGGGTAARLAGSAIEGAFYGLGQTATEQALGDPDLTAQKVVANIGLGALLNVGAHGAIQGIAGIGKRVAGDTAEGALSKFNNYMLGTPEADTAYYIANQQAVNAAPEVAAIKDAIDERVGHVQDVFNQSKAAYDNALADVKAMKPDNGLANDLHAAMEDEKQVLGQRGAQLEQVLENSGMSVTKHTIGAAIDTQLNALKIAGTGSTFGAGATAVRKYLEGLKDQLEQLPSLIDGSSLRQIVRSLRDDGAAAYGLAAGEFSEGKAKAASSIAETLNTHIRANPDAAAVLDDMRSRIQARQGLQQYFGTSDRALTSLQQAAGSDPKNALRLQALQAFDAATGSNFVARLKPYQDAQSVLESMKRVGSSAPAAIASIASPSPELTALSQAASLHDTNAQAWNAVKRLSAGRSQSVIESYMTKTAKAGESGVPPKFSLEDAAALDQLHVPSDKFGGQSIYDTMRARGVLDRFSASKANGSRHAVILGSLGTAVGGVLGGPLGAEAGAALGAAAGGAIDRQGGLAAKKIMDAVLMAQKAGNHGVTTPLGQMVLHKLGPAVVVGMKASTIATILEHLQANTSNDPREEQRARSLGQLERHSHKTTGRIEAGVRRFFEGGEVESRPAYEGKTEETMQDIRQLASNPEMLMNRIHAQTAALSDMAPKVTHGMNDMAVRAVRYLSSKIPTPTNRLALDGEPPVSRAQQSAFNVALQTVNDPLSVLEHAKIGTLTSAHLEALNNVYPHLAAEIRAHALNELSSKDAEALPYSKKTLMSKLAGAPLVRGLTPSQMASSQASMATAGAQDQAALKPAVRPGQKGLSKLDVGARTLTEGQQAASRRESR